VARAVDPRAALHPGYETGLIPQDVSVRPVRAWIPWRRPD